VLAIWDDALDRYLSEEQTDLLDIPHVRSLDVWETTDRSKVRRTRLINIYNKTRVHSDGNTIDHIELPPLICGRTMLAGDFHARSPAWDLWVAGRQNPGSHELRNMSLQ
jgi:hypothetical protein